MSGIPQPKSLEQVSAEATQTQSRMIEGFNFIPLSGVPEPKSLEEVSAEAATSMLDSSFDPMPFYIRGARTGGEGGGRTKDQLQATKRKIAKFIDYMPGQNMGSNLLLLQ
jgi:hypothetical protein